jgi:predicted DNA-binding transcriptional regulator
VRLKPAPDLAWQAVGPETVVIDLGRGRSIGLNQTAGLVWTLLAGMDEAAIVAEVARRYGIDVERARRDVKALLADLRERGLVEEA